MYYSGCGGNQNRFMSLDQCERQCGYYKGHDVCQDPRDPGPCDDYQTRYFYDRQRGTCDSFDYGNCEGNGNRFMSRYECESVCINRVEPESSDHKGKYLKKVVVYNSIGNYYLGVLIKLFDFFVQLLNIWYACLAICALPADVGYCEDQTPRYRYDEERGSCVQFIYTGCGGNLNNFQTLQACVDFCRGS